MPTIFRDGPDRSTSSATSLTNRRTSTLIAIPARWVTARLFLRNNGLGLAFTEHAAMATAFPLAADELSEDELAGRFREHLAEAYAAID